jgi:flagellar protein FlbT
MALRLTLKPNERILINGCVVRNADRRQMIVIENQADIVREADLLKEDEERTPVKEVYFIQTALLEPTTRKKLVSIIQRKLGALAPVFHDEMAGHIFEAAAHVSSTDFYKAMRTLRPLIEYEEKLFKMIREKNTATAAE